MQQFLFCVTVVLIFFCSCQHDSVVEESSSVGTELNLRLRDSLQLVREDHAALRSWRALERVQRLRKWVEHQEEFFVADAKAEIYQHLAVMSYERGLEDSVIHYTALADSYLSKHPSPLLLARQLLCEAFLKYTEWEWLEMDMLAAMGLAVLEGNKLQNESLYGQLLLTQGYARWKYANAWIEGPEFVRITADIEQIIRRAIRHYKAVGGARERQAWEDWALMAARSPDVTEMDFRATVDTLSQVGNFSEPVYAYPDRLLAYWHFRRGKPDSMSYYYERLLEKGPFYRLENPREANYIIKLNALAREDYQRALSLSLEDLRLSNCAQPTARLTVAAGEVSFSERYICPYLDLELAKVYLSRYRARGDTVDLHHAFDLTEIILHRYSKSFPSQGDEGVINKLVELGDVLLDVCLEAALEMEVLHSDAAMDAVFGTMELSQSLLLLRDLTIIGAADDQNRWQSLHATLEKYRQDYRKNFLLPLPQLQEFRELDARYRDAKKFYLGGRTQPEQFEGVSEVSEVSNQLKPAQVLLMATELRDEFIMLCINSDTAFTYRVPSTISNTIDSLRQFLTGETACNPREYATVAYQLYKNLLYPLETLPYLPTELLFVPSPGLAEIPLSALVLDTSTFVKKFADVRYVIDNYKVRYLPSWRVDLLHHAKRRTFKTKGGQIGIWTHPQLENYASRLTSYLKKNTINLGNVILGVPYSRDLLSQAADFDILHLTVHARGNTLRLHQNYLYLNERDSLNGIALAQLPLKAKLVVLAACATAEGYSQSGEGTFSLRRSFHLAGVPDVVSSLYDIPAAATVEILEHFYRNLMQGMPPATALAEAQRACRSGRISHRYAHPRYWAGLIMG